MRRSSVVLLGMAVVVVARVAAAEQSIPVRQVAPAEATSSSTAGYGTSARGLSDGRVLMLSYLPPKLAIFDRSLATLTVVADSMTLPKGPTGRPAALATIPYLADSTLLIDSGARTLLVLDPSGKVARVMAPARTDDVLWMTLGGLGRPAGGSDAAGHLFYRGTFPRKMPVFVPGSPPPVPESTPDSFPLIRADLETRKLDTIGVVNAPLGIKSATTRGSDNKLVFKTVRNPLPVADDWAVLSDGSVAIVRGHDYHIDWIYPDGTRASTAKMPFDWKRLTDDDKQHVIDSVQAMQVRMRAITDSMANARGVPPPPATISMLDPEFIPARELPDYYPALRSGPGSVLADRDANLWILPATSTQARAGLLYDVVNRRGELFERVQLPSGCTLAGFGPGGDVYLNCYTQQSSGLQRTRVLR